MYLSNPPSVRRFDRRAQLDALARPPESFGYVVATGEETVDVATGGRLLCCAVNPDVAPGLAPGSRVLLNEAMLPFMPSADAPLSETM